ncbi:hypothetical protein C8R45DRAFT_839115, partial [Mycena sanguinolenta]
SFIVTGIFSLRDGRKVSTPRAGASAVYHNHYITAIQCMNGRRIQGQLRVYSPHTDPILPNDTVILAFAKALFPPGRDAILDVFRVSVFPGNPASETYEDSMPDLPVPVVHALGHVSGPHHTLDDGHSSRAFPVTIGDYVHNSSQTCQIEAVYDGSTKRWTSTVLPHVNSCVQISGVCRELSPTGVLRINLDHIVLNVAPRTSQDSGGADDSPSKRRKYTAFAADTSAALAPASTSAIHTPTVLPPPPSAPAVVPPHTPMPTSKPNTLIYNTVTPAMSSAPQIVSPEMRRWVERPARPATPITPSPVSHYDIPVPVSPDIFSAPMPHFDTGYLQYLAFAAQMQGRQFQPLSSMASTFYHVPHGLPA